MKQAELIKNYPYITGVYYDGSFNYTNIDEYITNISEDLIRLSEILPDKEIVWILPQILLDKELPHIGEIIVKLKFKNINIKIQTDNIGVAKNLDVEAYGNHLVSTQSATQETVHIPSNDTVPCNPSSPQDIHTP